MADPEHIIWSGGYQSPHLLHYVALSLMFFGKTEVLRTTIFQRLAQVEEVYRLHDPSHMDAAKQKLLMDLMKDQLVDDFRIVTYFENVMKAKLLLDGVCIHRFQGKDEALTKTRNKALKQPWSGSNIIPAGIAEGEISRETIGMKVLLSPPYQKVIGLPEDVLRIVKDINKRRNKLHFNSFAEIGMGPSVLKDYRLLLDHVHETERFLSIQRFRYEP